MMTLDCEKLVVCLLIMVIVGKKVWLVLMDQDWLIDLPIGHQTGDKCSHLKRNRCRRFGRRRWLVGGLRWLAALRCRLRWPADWFVHSRVGE